jgi:tRNA dimethylallyltransferase
VAWWLGRAAAACRDIRARGHTPLLVGGTPLYLKALRHGLFDGPPADEALRARLTQEAERRGRPVLHERLARVDPASAARLHPNDLRRVIRALEVWELTGRPISAWQTQWSGEPARPRCLWLDGPRDELYRRIDGRVRGMVSAGLVEEVRALRGLGRPLSPQARQALGYKEMFAYLDGEIGPEEAVRRIQARTRQFAKRQLTWLRHLPGCVAVSPAAAQLTFAAWRLTMEGRSRGPGKEPTSPCPPAVL